MSDSTHKKGPKGPEGSRLQDSIHNAKEAFEAGGVDFPGVGGLLYVWRKFGWKGVVIIVLLVGFPFGEYSALRHAVYTALPRTVGGLGLEFHAEEWSLALLKMRATARNVRIQAPSDEKPVLTAGEIEFQGSAWTLLTGLPDLITFHMFGGHQPFNEIVVRHGELHLERSLTGHLNWNDFIEAVPKKRVQEALEGVYEVEDIRFEDFRVTYIENVPGGSGDGVIRTAQAQIKVDEIRASFVDLVQPERRGEIPTSFKVNGRSADGVFEIQGKAAFFPSKDSMPDSDGESDMHQVSMKEGGEGGRSYPYEMSVYLENVAAAAAGKMVPVLHIVPVNGSVGGTTKFIRTATDLRCEGGFTLKDVRFAPNPLKVTKPSDVETVKLLAKDVAYTGPFEFCSDGEDVNLPAAPAGEPPASIIMTRLTRQATRDASPELRAIVAHDQQVLRGQKQEMSMDALTSAIANELGQSFARSLAQKTGTESGGNAAGNALGKGVKSVGSGIKKLFGK